MKSKIRSWKAAKNGTGYSRDDILGISKQNFEKPTSYIREMQREDYLDKQS